ncbi:CLUMA_CG002954, isoform A [Clunio marinus]|uniref:CLUMA_CG002954, isoform A n=1 Tax=Clunio marinus TaxID=568069 RepID=A0A1J1HNT7_9DIPT|nr:CLUMA_CG002954, isoform A [Clunio marinus]
MRGWKKLNRAAGKSKESKVNSKMFCKAWRNLRQISINLEVEDENNSIAICCIVSLDSYLHIVCIYLISVSPQSKIFRLAQNH